MKSVFQEVSLGWEISRRNCLMSGGGYSPNQLLFGRNISLPNLWGEDEANPVISEKRTTKSILSIII